MNRIVGALEELLGELRAYPLLLGSAWLLTAALFFTAGAVSNGQREAARFSAQTCAYRLSPESHELTYWACGPAHGGDHDR